MSLVGGQMVQDRGKTVDGHGWISRVMMVGGVDTQFRIGVVELRSTVFY